MSQINLVENKAHYHATKGAEKYCRECWRDDFHSNVSYSPVVLGFLMVATCGLILVARPSRCICCGTMRIF